MTTAIKLDPRSASQYAQYNRCPEAYRLSRLVKDESGKPLWRRPAAWLPQGTAVHVAYEAWEKSGRTMTVEEAQDVFRIEYSLQVSEYSESTPDFKKWSRSGPYDGEADIERRYLIGVEQVARIIEYYTTVAPKEKPWITPNGDLAVELPFEIMLGAVPVRGYIDVVMELPRSLRVRDLKTGKDPGSVMQLRLYGEAIKELFGRIVSTGDYFMARTGGPTVPYRLNEWTSEWLVDEFGKLDEAIREERFDPDPEPSKCMFCDVSAHCKSAIFS